MSLDLFIFIITSLCTSALVFIPLVNELIEREPNPISNKVRGKGKRSNKNIPKKKKALFGKFTTWGKLFLFVSILTLGFTIWGKIRDDNKKRLDELKLSSKDNEYKEELRKLRYTIDTLSVDPADNVSEGFSLSSILNFDDILDRRKKYVFDCGESLTMNRISLFLDYDNNLVFSIVDNSSVTYSVRTVPNFITFKKGATYFLHCDIGYSKDYSFLRIFLDDRLVGQQSFNNRIAGEKLKWENCRIGGDLEGKNNGAFMVSDVVAFGKVFRRKEIKDIMYRLIPN